MRLIEDKSIGSVMVVLSNVLNHDSLYSLCWCNDTASVKQLFDHCSDISHLSDVVSALTGVSDLKQRLTFGCAVDLRLLSSSIFQNVFMEA